MSRETAAKIAVRDALIKLVEANISFKTEVLNNKNLPSWVMREGLAVNWLHYTDRELAAEMTTQLTYLPKQNKQETTRLPGLVGISSKTLELGYELNEAKQAFKQAMSHYRHLFGDTIESIEQTSDELRGSLLGGLKIQHIHFVQSYRQLKLFASPPKRVGFSWAATHSGTVRLTAVKAIEHLRKKYLPSSAIINDIEILAQMPVNEIVVIKRDLVPHLRANITWQKAITTDKGANPPPPKQINAPIPIFFLLKQGHPLPKFNTIAPFNPLTKQTRLQRNDARLQKITENPHSRIYRYATVSL